MTPPKSDFETAYYINLDHRQDRRESFERMAKYLPVKQVVRFPAVYGNTLDQSKWEGTAGALGIRESHIRLLKQAKSNGVNKFMVFEDDAVIGRSFAIRLKEMMKEIGNDWDMVYLYAENHYIRPLQFSKNVVQLQNTLGLVGVAYNDRNIDTIIDKLENDYRWVDSCMAELHLTLKVFAPKRSIIGHADGFSDNIGIHMRTDISSLERIYKQAKNKANNIVKRLKKR